MLGAMVRSDVVEALRGIPLFAAVPEKQLQRLGGAMRARTIAAGEEVVVEGSGGVGFFVIESGEASVSQSGEQIAALGPGDTFGEMALIDRGPRSATVRATTELNCHGMTAWEFRPLVEENPEIAWSLLETLVARVREAEARAAELTDPGRAAPTPRLSPGLRSYLLGLSDQPEAETVDKSEWIWINGEFVAWDDAQVHVLSHGLHYGTGVFEGIRCYETDRGPAVFRHRDHLERLANSAELFHLPLPYRPEQIHEATNELIRRNRLRSCYIRPLAFRGYGEMGLYAPTGPVDMMVAVWPWGAYLGEEGKANGVRAAVSSWRRISPAGLIPHAKASGQYLNSILAKTEAAQAGYDEAILLDEGGLVCEGSGENIFCVRDGELVTPGHNASILDGISRKSVIQIATDLGYTVVEREIARAELYLAEEVFLCGTAAELVPVREIDGHELGEPGEITRVIQAKFDDALHGRAPEYAEWLDLVEAARRSSEGAEPSRAAVEAPSGGKVSS